MDASGIGNAGNLSNSFWDYKQPRYCNINDCDLTDQERMTANSVLELRTKIANFISKYGLEKKWLKYALLETLMLLAVHPNLKGGLFLTEFSMHFINDPPVFRVPLWNPTVQSLKDYQKDAKSSFKLIIDQYTSEIDNDASQAYVSGKGRPRDFDRVKMLIRWTVQQWTAARIAKEFNISERGFWGAMETFKNSDLPVRIKNDTEV